MATLTLRQSSFWSDFSTTTNQPIAPSVAIPVGHRAFFVLASTVDRGVEPSDPNYAGIHDPLTDSVGHTWNVDSAGPVDVTDSGTTVQIWSTVVTTQIGTSGVTLSVVPDTNGLSADWFLFDFDPAGGVTSLDKVASGLHVGFNTTMPTGTTATTTSTNELVLGVVGVGSASGTFTVAGPWSVIAQYSGGQDGSDRAIAVVYQIVSATGTYGVNVTAGASSSYGMGAIATYAITAGDSSIAGARASATAAGKQGSVSINNPSAPSSPSAAKLIVNQAAQRWST